MIEAFNNDRHKYSIRQDAVNGVGFKYIVATKYKMGLVVLEFNASQYPQSTDVYESLAEAYRISGNKQMAITNIKKSLELNPDNDNAKEMLKRLETK